MRTIRVGLAAALALTLTSTPLLAQLVQPAPTPRRSFLFKDSRGELAAARAKGDTNVLLVMASMPGANARVAKLIAALGGTVRYRDDDVDYLRVRIPVDSVEKLVRHQDVHSVDINVYRNRTYASDAPEALSAEPNEPVARGPVPPWEVLQDTTRKRWPPRLQDNPLTDRYDPLEDIGALDFRRQHPTFDGRGVTIAMIDMSPDPLLPELQVATSIDGKRIPKIAFFETSLDGVEEDGIGRWLAMKDSVVVTGGLFTYKDKQYRAPSDGVFRIDLLDETQIDSSDTVMKKDLNRDGNPDGSSRLFAVIWNEKTNDVWVDANQNLSFTDEKGLTDFSVRQEFGLFGTDDPKTPVRESIAFAIQLDRAKRSVGVLPGNASHASLVVGAVLASKGDAGRFDGVAPGARLAAVAEGGAAYGQTEALIRALKNPAVDIAFMEQSSVITGRYLLRDGRLVPTVIYSRLVEKYRKPIMSPTHNNPIVNASDDFVRGNGVIGVGAHESADNFFKNFAVRVKHKDGLHTTGGYGPMGDGAIAPDIISPSNILSTRRGFEVPARMNNVYELPQGYMIAGGTSTATPVATGGVSMLISAAKQTGIKYDAFRIKHAITSSGRHVDHLPAYKQGNGVINVAGAWEILKVLDTLETPVAISTRAPVRHSYSQLLPLPNEGVGFYERDGWKPGDRSERTITVTRTHGPKGDMTFALRWAGNDAGTYSAPPTIALPLGKAVPLTIGVAPKESGVHSALLTFDHPSVPGHAHRMSALIVAAEALDALNNYTIETKSEVPRPEMRSWFYRVPEGVQSLRIDVDAPKRELQLGVFRPDTRTARTVRLAAPAPAQTFAPPSADRPKATYVVNDPGPGVWEVRLTDVEDARTFDHEQAEKDEPAPPTKVTLTVSAIAAEVKAVGTAIVESGGGFGASTPVETMVAANTFDVSMTNRMATFMGAIAGQALGSARRERATIGDKEQRVYEIDVPAGSPLLAARISGIADAKADLDVMVYDCSGKTCRSAGIAADPFGDESVVVQNPAPGKWKVVVDAPAVPGGTTQFDYVDVVFNPAYGAVGVTDVSQERKLSAQWTARAHVWSAGALPAGRSPYVGVLLQTQPRAVDPVMLELVELLPNGLQLGERK